MFKKYGIIVFTLISLALVTCNPEKKKEPVVESNEIQVAEVMLVDSVVADFPVGFQFLFQEGRHYASYYNKSRELTVASRKVTEDKWQYKILPTKVGWDSHNRITMTMDGDNCLHVSGNMHNDSLIYFKTERPHDVSSFERVFPQVALEDELSSTYPGFIKNSEGALIFSYRKGGSGNGITISNIYDEESKTFSRLTDAPLFDGLNQMSAYARGPSLGPDKMFHIIWYWRDTPGCETNHDLSYARSKDLINWETLDGTKMELPITPESSQFTADPVPAKSGAINGGATHFFNSDNKPLIAHMKYDEAGMSQIYLAHDVNGKWVSDQVSDWDYRWNFSGPGSMTFKIRLGRCNVNEEDKIVIPYTHVKYGNGELIADNSSFTLIEDRRVDKSKESDYPADLMVPTSGIDSVSVRWLQARGSKANNGEYYALRWETMGKRRFYKPRAIPVKPSALTLYKFSKKK
ncbi:MAG: BNR repeat-containing protein [Cyclobacteriaceae bacterium]